METDNTIRVTKLKGENFGRIAHNVLSRYIVEGETSHTPANEMNAIQLLRSGPFPAKKPVPESGLNKIILLDMRSKEEYL